MWVAGVWSASHFGALGIGPREDFVEEDSVDALGQCVCGE